MEPAGERRDEPERAEAAVSPLLQEVLQQVRHGGPHEDQAQDHARRGHRQEHAQCAQLSCLVIVTCQSTFGFAMQSFPVLKIKICFLNKSFVLILHLLI